ncbi:MAG: DUF5680 domain-containing protein [Thermoplasmataceae archaeon]
MTAESVFINFLVDAKKHTYVAKDDVVSGTPLLPKSNQLEYIGDSFLYRDIYFGSRYFVGQETVYHIGEPYWAMVYSGGIINLEFEQKTKEIYSFLKSSLRLVSDKFPFRGPPEHVECDHKYVNFYEGKINRFKGKEIIYLADLPVYRCDYSGGLIV